MNIQISFQNRALPKKKKNHFTVCDTGTHTHTHTATQSTSLDKQKDRNSHGAAHTHRHYLTEAAQNHHTTSAYIMMGKTPTDTESRGFDSP